MLRKWSRTMVVRLEQKPLTQRRPVKTLSRELDEIDADCKWHLRVGDVSKAIELSRKWVRLARAGGLIR
jgi:hypothetical protein